ncbi:hemolymph lipopolysaccharide-binding protein isoform X1 [Anabrus simplex]|uniref:hemolymph lipopolysaccharide-binding protein isoform X1 n=1 Tax=Anabrus simplex TaxID=316456 RepID=UPI0035A2CE85
MFVFLLLVGAVAANSQCETSPSLKLSVSCANNQTVQGEITSNVPFKDAVDQFMGKWRDTCDSTARVDVSPGSSDYQLIPGHGYYKVHNVLLTWDEGRRLCEMDGAHMVVFDSQEEADAVFEIADCCPWVGVSRQNSRSPWMTVLGQPLSSTGFTGWATGYPLESGNCNMIFKNNGIGMINWICSLNLGVICEKPLN